LGSVLAGEEGVVMAAPLVKVEDRRPGYETRYGCCLSALAGLARYPPASLPGSNMVGFRPKGKGKRMPVGLARIGGAGGFRAGSETAVAALGGKRGNDRIEIILQNYI